jgi:membrane protein DedA with SNARE-associated domain
MFFALAQQWHHAHSGIFVYVAIVALMVGLAIACAFVPAGGDLPLVGVAAMMSVGAWLSVRNMGVVALTTSGPLARHLTGC